MKLFILGLILFLVSFSLLIIALEIIYKYIFKKNVSKSKNDIQNLIETEEITL